MVKISRSKAGQGRIKVMENIGNNTKKCLSCPGVISLFARECEYCGARYDDEVDQLEKTIKALESKENKN